MAAVGLTFSAGQLPMLDKKGLRPSVVSNRQTSAIIIDDGGTINGLLCILTKLGRHYHNSIVMGTSSSMSTNERFSLMKESIMLHQIWTSTVVVGASYGTQSTCMVVRELEQKR